MELEGRDVTHLKLRKNSAGAIDGAKIQSAFDNLFKESQSSTIPALKVACASYCRNCLASGRLAEHKIRNCSEDWVLKCQKCDQKHPTWKH